MAFNLATAFKPTLAAPARSAVQPRVAAPVAMAAPRDMMATAGKAAGVGLATLALIAQAAGAVTIKMGGDTGALVFEPSAVTIKAGDSVTWKNNAGFPHNVVFDEDEIPAGVNADAISHEDYLNAPGEEVTTKFTKPGKYAFHCEPHEGAGMNGTVTVE